jgi:Ca2+-binding EF-hand superfamily protein
MAGLPLSESEFNLIVNNFSDPDKNDYVRWKDFCDAVEQVFTVKNLEKVNPADELIKSNIEFHYGRKGMDEQEVRMAERVKINFRRFCTATRLDIKQFFQDWDRLGRNKVTPKQFRQVLATVNFSLSDQEFSAIIRLYSSDDQKDVRYIDFINATQPGDDLNDFSALSLGHMNLVTKREPHQLQKASLEYLGLCQKGEGRGAEEVVILNKIKTAVKVNRLRMDEYLKDYDPLNKGVLPANKFRSILSAMKYLKNFI